jgi:hypothetical protein
MSDTPPLGVDAVDLLLSIAESPGIAISHATLEDFHMTAGTALVAVGALKADDFEAVAPSQADHDDAAVSLTWSSELNGYAYFSPAVGLVRVDDDRLRRFKLDFSWFLQWIALHLGIRTTARPLCLVPDRLWDLGDIWLGETKRMRRRTAIYVATRLNEPRTVTQLAGILDMHSTRTGKLILTTTNDPNLARMLIGDSCAILSVKSCARAGTENFELDTAIIYSAAHCIRAPQTELPIQANADFRIIRVGKRDFRFRGDKQRQIIGFLYKRWLNGKGPISTAFMFEELEFGNTKRLRDLFKDHTDWQELIGYKDGACWLRFDELLAKVGSMVDRA